MVALNACGDPAASDIRKRARWWVERQSDSLSTDSLQAGAFDSLRVDSLSQTWGTEEWLRFWNEVDKEQSRRLKALDTTVSKR
jgi:hypothetical protein